MAYADTETLADILEVDEEDNETELQQVLDAAATEIDSELGLAEPFAEDAIPALVVEVNLERAVEHWKQRKVAFGLIGLGGSEVPAFAATDTFNRHAAKLAPLKEAWGLA